MALGLLGNNSTLSEQVTGDFYQPGLMGAVRVGTFLRRSRANTPFGIWSEIASQLNKRAAFKDLYAPLSPPGQSDWVDPLWDEPALILSTSCCSNHWCCSTSVD